MAIMATSVILGTTYSHAASIATLQAVWYCMLATTFPSLVIVATQLFGGDLPLRRYEAILAGSKAAMDVICLLVSFTAGMAFQLEDAYILSSYACIWMFVYAATGLLCVLAKAYDAAVDPSLRVRFSREDEVRTVRSDENVVSAEDDNA